jgi:protein-S-isoprenylcysteine O-methyltransferase Ste14
LVALAPRSIWARVAIAIALVVLPVLMHSGIETAAISDWARCNGPERAPSAVRDYLSSWRDFIRHPTLILWVGCGYMAAMGLWVWTKSPWALVWWAFIVATTLLSIANPETWHDCDRKGTHLVFRVVGIQVIATILTLLALAILIWKRRQKPQEPRI